MWLKIHGLDTVILIFLFLWPRAFTKRFYGMDMIPLFNRRMITW